MLAILIFVSIIVFLFTDLSKMNVSDVERFDASTPNNSDLFKSCSSLSEISVINAFGKKCPKSGTIDDWILTTDNFEPNQKEGSTQTECEYKDASTQTESEALIRQITHLSMIRRHFKGSNDPDLNDPDWK